MVIEINTKDETKKASKRAIVTIIVSILLYCLSIVPAFAVTGLLMMSIAIPDIPLVYLAMGIYLLSLPISVTMALYLFVKQRYRSASKTVLIPIVFVVLFVLAFYFIAIPYEG